MGGDAWVEPNEFPQLLMNLFYFNKLFRCFEAVDTDDDRRIDEKEFEKGIKLCGLDMDKSDAKAEFDAMDSNDGGVVLFDEYCIWYTKKVNPTREIVDSTSLFVGEVRGGKRKKKGKKKKKKGPKDAMPDYESKKFDKLEKELIATAKDPVALAKLWDVMDFNDNQIVSLAEIDKLMVQSYPLLNHKPALMRAYKQTCLREGGDGDAWVEPNEFPQLLVNLFYFNKLFQCFEQVDTDDDRRLDEKEFIEGLDRLGMNLSDDEAKASFDDMDSNDGGIVLFDEFCIWFTKQVSPEREIVDSTSQFADERRGKRKKKKGNKKKKKGPRDDMPDYSSKDFDELEAKIHAIAKDPAELAKLWDVMDFNDNQIVSLAEIDKLMVQDYPLLNHKPALMRAYKQTCLKEGGDGDAWV